MPPTRNSLQISRQTKSEGMEKNMSCKWKSKKKKKKPQVAVLVSDKINFKTMTVARNKDVT